MLPQLQDCDLEQLRVRFNELDAYAQAVELDLPERVELQRTVYVLGGSIENAWNDYHLVRNEYDRRAAEEFDLGQ